jgi:hypothetical protein
MGAILAAIVRIILYVPKPRPVIPPPANQPSQPPPNRPRFSSLPFLF